MLGDVDRMAIVLTGIVFLFFAETLPAYAAKVDIVQTAGAKGQEVVDAVVDLIHHSCVFEDDSYFLRRLAFVESRDGLNGNTYRLGYNGGIWQVDEDKFRETQSSVYATRYFTALRLGNMGIDWRHVQWTDLRKPLYSGLAARLYMEVMTHGKAPSRGISEQAVIWHRDYHHSNPAPTSNFTATAALLTESCSGDRPIDVVFIMDNSGSIAASDFDKAKEFVVQWISAFTFGPQAVQLAVVKYSTSVVEEFYLNQYTTTADLIRHVRAIKYAGGSTATGMAIDIAVDRVLAETHGGRRGVPQAAILITDGQSNDHTAAVRSAARARSRGVTLYAVGVGQNIDQSELEDIATDPDCTHVFLVKDYSVIEALKQQMQEATCKTVIHLISTNNTNTETHCELGKTCSPIAVPTTNTTENTTEKALVTTVNCGTAVVYAAYNNPNPGSAYYEIKAVATENKPAVILLDSDGRTLYVTVRGQSYKLSQNETHNGTLVCEAVTDIRNKSEIPHHVTKPGHVDVQCVERGNTRQCTAADLKDFKEDLCQTSWEFTNPCTRAALLDGNFYFPHPLYLDRYLMCDWSGKLYIVQCPPGHTYNFISKTCGTGHGTPGNATAERVLLPANQTNPCTVEAILAGHMLFAFVRDNTMFISCDVWGKAWLHHCSEGFIWDPKDMRCVVESVHVQGPGPLGKDVENPCTKEAIAAGRYFFPYPPAADRYIQCDLWGDAYVMLCFVGGHWNELANSCV